MTTANSIAATIDFISMQTRTSEQVIEEHVPGALKLMEGLKFQAENPGNGLPLNILAYFGLAATAAFTKDRVQEGEEKKYEEFVKRWKL
jgi:hypothetical protein